MPKSSLRSVIAAAIVVLGVLWEDTDEKTHLTLGEVVARCATKGAKTDKRLVYATVDAARDAGLKIERPTGKGRHSDGYRWERKPISSWEVGFLCDATSCSRSLTSREKASLKSRLLTLVPRHQRPALSREISVGCQIDVYRGDLEKKLGAIGEALRQGRRIDFTYWEVGTTGKVRKRESSSQVEVEPYRILYQNESYYLLAGKVADDGINPRTYRLDRMDGIRILDALCELSLDALHINVEEVLSESFGMFMGEKAETVTLAFEQGVAKHVAERFGPKVIRKVDGDSGYAKVKVRPSPPFYAWVFQFAGAVTIEGPSHIVKEYQSMLKRCIGESQQTTEPTPPLS